MPDFSKSRAGDGCYHLRWGECEITKVDIGRVYIKTLPNGSITGIFSSSGRAYDDDKNPIIYHSRPEISDPPPPKRMVKITVWQNWYLFPNTGESIRSSRPFTEEGYARSISKNDKNYIGTFPTELEYEEEGNAKGTGSGKP